MRLSSPRQAALFVVAITFLSGLTRADFIPIPLTSDSFNQDVVVEKTAPSPIVPVTTASMDSGITNTGYGWYEKGYNLDSPATGLPSPGSVIASDMSPDDTYQFAPSYKSNNAVMIDRELTNATLTLATPAPYSRLSFLVASGNGPGSVQVIIHHQDSTTETGTVFCTDWMSSVGEAYVPAGRVDVGTSPFDSVGLNHPALFTRGLALSNSNSAVTAIDFGYSSGLAHNAIFAVSGSANQVDPLVPIVVTGFNADLVVESSAPRRAHMSGVTTASMEGGTINGFRTWYERGYYPLSPATGLPAAGSILTSSLAADHRYALASSYTDNNALLIDYDLSSGTLTPATPTACTTLSFLCAAGRGPVTIQCVINHANGSSETNSLIVPNWFDNSPIVFSPNGAINLDTRIVDSVGANNPRLYFLDVPLVNSVSPVTNVILAFTNGGANSHAAFFAMSGSSGQSTSTRPVLSISILSGGNLRIATSQSGQLQSTSALNGTNTVWQNEGFIAGAIDVSPGPGIPGKFYRVIGQ